MFIIKEELDQFKEIYAKIIQIFYSKRTGLGSGSGRNTIIPAPDPTCPKSSGSTTLVTDLTVLMAEKYTSEQLNKLLVLKIATYPF
jgi:hypothetical protein